MIGAGAFIGWALWAVLWGGDAEGAHCSSTNPALGCWAMQLCLCFHPVSAKHRPAQPLSSVVVSHLRFLPHPWTVGPGPTAATMGLLPHHGCSCPYPFLVLVQELCRKVCNKCRQINEKSEREVVMILALVEILSWVLAVEGEGPSLQQVCMPHHVPKVPPAWGAPQGCAGEGLRGGCLGGVRTG